MPSFPLSPSLPLSGYWLCICCRHVPSSLLLYSSCVPRTCICSFEAGEDFIAQLIGQCTRQPMPDLSVFFSCRLLAVLHQLDRESGVLRSVQRQLPTNFLAHPNLWSAEYAFYRNRALQNDNTRFDLPPFGCNGLSILATEFNAPPTRQSCRFCVTSSFLHFKLPSPWLEEVFYARAQTADRRSVSFPAKVRNVGNLFFDVIRCSFDF